MPVFSCDQRPRCCASGHRKKNTPHALACGSFLPFFEGAIGVRLPSRLDMWRISALLRACGSGAAGGAAMRHVQHSVRLPIALDRALRQLAARREMTPYALLQNCVRTGLATMTQEGVTGSVPAELATELGQVSTQIVHVERLTERALYVSCAAYVFARAAAPTRIDETRLTDDINDAFQRQLALAGDTP
ncbi:hypothetical protein HLH44_10435 [Gluconacetobacter sp. 1c LMG 22058]|uniref:Uncharacterized protein n=2 Tax=Gluconacetobacter dulcium TaxID=2729096 RepID=A0A7W4K002_9PROT|nr:hypothetical protein [Gluconacetobacter dulcium]